VTALAGGYFFRIDRPARQVARKIGLARRR
jgi:hypothetical protein